MEIKPSRPILIARISVDAAAENAESFKQGLINSVGEEYLVVVVGEIDVTRVEFEIIK